MVLHKTIEVLYFPFVFIYLLFFHTLRSFNIIENNTELPLHADFMFLMSSQLSNLMYLLLWVVCNILLKQSKFFDPLNMDKENDFILINNGIMPTIFTIVE